MRWTGQIFWLLAYVPISVGITFSPPSPPKNFGDWPNWEVVSSYSSATAPDSHGISCADPLFQARKELEPSSSGLHFERQDYLITKLTNPSCALDSFCFEPDCHWRRRFHRLQSHACAAGKISGGASHCD